MFRALHGPDAVSQLYVRADSSNLGLVGRINLICRFCKGACKYCALRSHVTEERAPLALACMQAFSSYSSEQNASAVITYNHIFTIYQFKLSLMFVFRISRGIVS